MEIMLWILLCLFTSVGIVQCGQWLLEWIRKPLDLCYSYHVIPLYDDPEGLEAHIRLALYEIRRSYARGECVLLADMGMGEESNKICENLLWEMDGVYICDIHDVPKTIKLLDNLQNTANDVK